MATSLLGSLRMEVGHLRKDELDFELRVRGVDTTDKTVDEMRLALRPLIKIERKGSTPTYPPYAYDYDVELAVLGKKYTELLTDINLFQEPTCTTLDKARLGSRLAHLYHRISIAPIQDVDPELLSSRSEWLAKVSKLFKLLETAVQTRIDVGALDYSSVFARRERTPSSSSGEYEHADVPGPAGHSTPHHEQSSPTAARTSQNSVPIHKWNLKFTGEPSGMSVLAFLERVQELRTARHIGETELFSSAIDLFEGKALLWYRSVEDRVRNWRELADLLTLHYLPPDYRHRLFQDILSRTQGPKEKIIEYLAVTRALCKRHGSIPDDVRLSILMRNLSPFYLEKIPAVTSIEELESECLKIEARKFRVDHYKPPATRTCEYVEPALACLAAEPEIDAVEDSRTYPKNDRRDFKCFGCGGKGHMRKDCPSLRNKPCPRCKRPNTTARDCPNCNQARTTSGNDPARR